MIPLFEQIKTEKIQKNCPRCGSSEGAIFPHHFHLAELSCARCERWLKWLSVKDFERAKSANLVND